MIDIGEIFLVSCQRVFVKLDRECDVKPRPCRAEAQATNAREKVNDFGLLHAEKLEEARAIFNTGISLLKPAGVAVNSNVRQPRGGIAKAFQIFHAHAVGHAQE